MTLKLYNTLSRQLEAFKPLTLDSVGLYTCGPTVYNYAHIGNLRTYIFEDILKRVLKYNDYKVKHVMNITDVGHLTSDADEGEDKMEKGAKREGKTAWDIAKFYTEAFQHDLEDLNIEPPNIWCKATDHIKEQIALVKTLEKKGFTYKTSDGIYFDTTKLPDYGKLANLKKQELKAGARVDLGEKKNPHDFALWKLSVPSQGAHPERAERVEGSLVSLQKRQMEWPSPWGVGFPGWHIECSAMSVKYLGNHFDIHCGGIDHIPVHHTNEIAQTETATGKVPWVNTWMHGEFLVIPNGDKMAKSGNNFITLQTLKEKRISPLAYRYFCLQTHYRKPLTFSWEALEAAQKGLEHLYNAASELATTNTTGVLATQFLNNLNNNLNLPAALAVVWQAITERRVTRSELLQFDEVLGLQIKKQLEKPTEPLSSEIQKLVDDRDAVRAVKDWAKSDELRKKLEEMGYEVKDTKDGTKIK